MPMQKGCREERSFLSVRVMHIATHLMMELRQKEHPWMGWSQHRKKRTQGLFCIVYTLKISAIRLSMLEHQTVTFSSFCYDRLAGMTVLFDTGSGTHRRLINMTEVGEAYTPEYRAVLLALHAFCGCDTTSAFEGRGHILPIKTLEKLPRFTRPLARLGNAWRKGEDLLRELEEYTCAMYGNSRFTSVDELRLFKLKEICEGKPTTAMRNMDMSTLPHAGNAYFSMLDELTTNYQFGRTLT